MARARLRFLGTPSPFISCRAETHNPFAGYTDDATGEWINTGKEKLVTFFVFRADAGHDYGTIEQKGYRKLVVERDGKPTMIDNPRWDA